MAVAAKYLHERLSFILCAPSSLAYVCAHACLFHLSLTVILHTGVVTVIVQYYIQYQENVISIPF